MRRERQTAKKVIYAYANELLARTNDPAARDKLLAIEQIAFRLGWDLYDRLRFRKSNQIPPPQETEKPEPWWQK